MDGFLTAKQVCKMLHIARETVARWERGGEFPHRYRFSRAERGRVGFRESEVRAWIEARRPNPEKPAA